MRKFESMFYKTDTFLQENTICIELQAEQIFSVNIQNAYFFYFRRGFCGVFSMLFPKAPASFGKKIWNNFHCIVIQLVWAQKECLRFLKSCFKLKVLIFLSFAVSFLVDMFSQKAPFLTRKAVVKSGTQFSREAAKN